jgi:hypothetical protein
MIRLEDRQILSETVTRNSDPAYISHCQAE